MIVRKYYSMRIETPKDHREYSKFVFARWWNITNVASFDKVITTLKKLTQKDSIGRVLCYGTDDAQITTIQMAKRWTTELYGYIILKLEDDKDG